MQLLGLLLIFSAVFRIAKGNCDDTLDQVVCGSLSDLENYEVGSWTDLRIGDSKVLYEDSPDKVADNLFFDKFRHLHSLTIINQLRDFNIDNSTYPWMEYINLYGNNMEYLMLTWFNRFPNLRMLSARRNNIINIYASFSSNSLKTVDLSDNLIDTIKTEHFVNSSIKWLSLQHNKLEQIGPDAMPKTLLVLKLDYNNLYNFQDDIVQADNLLEELTITHNKIIVLLNFQNLPNLRLLDLSHNELAAISDVFSDLKSLQYLDLSYNKITRIDNNFRYRENLYGDIRISIAFNRLSVLDYYAVSNLFGHKVIRTSNLISLYGNPFCCDCMARVERYLFQAEVNKTDCDKEHYGTGKVPICLIRRSDSKNVEKYKPPSEADLQYFLASYHQVKTRYIQCDLRKDFYKDINVLFKRNLQ